jgi:hypothetical protein
VEEQDRLPVGGSTEVVPEADAPDLGEPLVKAVEEAGSRHRSRLSCAQMVDLEKQAR